MPLPLFDERHVEGPKLTPDTPEYQVFWRQLRTGYEGQPFTFSDPDERLMRYARDGHRIGRLFRPLPCVMETR